MKKLSIICVLVLVLGLMAASVFALEFKFDFYGGDTGLAQGDFEDPQEVTLFQSETVMVDIWLTGWDTGGRGNVAYIDYYFTWHTDSLFINSVVCNNLKTSVPPGQFDDQYADIDALGIYAMGVVEYGIGVAGPNFRLHTVELHCGAPADAWIKASLSPDGVVGNTFGDEWTDVTDGDGVLHQAGKECQCEVAPEGVVLGRGESQEFTASQKEPADCANPSYFVWSTNCTRVTTDLSECAGNDTCTVTGDDCMMYHETCTVTVTDMANTVSAGSQVACTVDVHLEPPP